MAMLIMARIFIPVTFAHRTPCLPEREVKLTWQASHNLAEVVSSTGNAADIRLR